MVVELEFPPFHFFHFDGSVSFSSRLLPEGFLFFFFDCTTFMAGSDVSYLYGGDLTRGPLG
jgi:hypothetical protein